MHTSCVVLAALCVAQVWALNTIEKLSFGTKGSISQNSFSIPGWTISGEGYEPQLLSDKVILTPPYGGNKRGALWATAKNTEHNWEVELEFRASGQDHGRANLVLWYVKDGSAVSTSSVYTVGKFDGLALLIDQNQGVPKIRGFLNDGTTDYKNHQNVDGLAFGHCDYNYRNLGRPSKIALKSTSAGLQILVDNQRCFETSKVILPVDYNFGLTAASKDPPDSFEIFKFQVSTATAPAQIVDSGTPNAQKPLDTKSFATNSVPADVTQQRLNQIEKSLANMLSEVNRQAQSQEMRYNEILQLLKSGKSANAAGAGAAIGNLEARLSTLDRTITALSSDLRGSLNHDEKFAKISQQLQDTHEGITHHLPGAIRGYVQNHTPRIGFIVFSFMAFQSCCLAVLMWQKYRKGTMPKKFL